MFGYLGVFKSLDNLDFNLEDLFLWIKFTLAALSRAEKAADKLLALGFFLASLTSLLTILSRLAFLPVRVLSFRTFLIADLIIGIQEAMLSWRLVLCKHFS